MLKWTQLISLNSKKLQMQLDVNIYNAKQFYGDQVFFDFAMPQLITNPNFNASQPISSTNKPLISNSNSFIKPIDIATNHFHVYHDFGDGRVVDVELYDIENAWFSDGAGGMELKPLTEGRPITKDDFGNLVYGRGEVKFWVEYDDVSSKNDGFGSTWGGGTTISVVTTRVKTVIDPTTKERITYEDPTVHWKGLASEANPSYLMQQLMSLMLHKLISLAKCTMTLQCMVQTKSI